MSEEQGIVLRAKHDGWADVLTERKDACANCGASHCCVGADTGSKMLTRAINKIGATSGDLVAITLRSGLVVKSAAVIYLVPILGFIGGAIVGTVVHSSIHLSESGAAILFGFGGLVGGYLLTSAISRWMSTGGKLTPVISRIIVKGAEDTAPAIDPVCNMAVPRDEAAATSIYNGVTYYFCSIGCKQQFDQQPARYVEGGDTA